MRRAVLRGGRFRDGTQHDGATRAPEEIHAQIKEQYGQLAATNLIAEYNHQRLYLN
jgi:hypothetical protein